ICAKDGDGFSPAGERPGLLLFCLFLLFVADALQFLARRRAVVADTLNQSESAQGVDNVRESATGVAAGKQALAVAIRQAQAGLLVVMGWAACDAVAAEPAAPQRAGDAFRLSHAPPP